MRLRRILTATSVVSPWYRCGWCAIPGGDTGGEAGEPVVAGERARSVQTQGAILPESVTSLQSARVRHASLDMDAVWPPMICRLGRYSRTNVNRSRRSA